MFSNGKYCLSEKCLIKIYVGCSGSLTLPSSSIVRTLLIIALTNFSVIASCNLFFANSGFVSEIHLFPFIVIESSALDLGGVFLRFIHRSFFLLLTPAGGFNPAGPTF